MSQPMPEQRPALRKAPDAAVHPIVATTPIGDLGSKAGATTADAVKPKADKPVTLELAVPKSLRRTLRREAERRGMTVDDLVVALLRDRTAG